MAVDGERVNVASALLSECWLLLSVAVIVNALPVTSSAITTDQRRLYTLFMFMSDEIFAAVLIQA